jgi:hypothetical protein
VLPPSEMKPRSFGPSTRKLNTSRIPALRSTPKRPKC